MGFLDSYDMLEGRVTISVMLVLIMTIWIIVKVGFRVFRISNKFPKLTVLANLIVIPSVILLIGSLAHQRHASLGFGDLSDTINTLTLLGILLAVGWCLARLVEIFMLSRQTDDDANYLPGLQRGLLFAGFLLLSFILFFNIMEYSVTGLYVSTGAVAAVLAFAMQRTLGDLFSGVALSVERPFRLGDWIELEDGTQGQIIDINWRATKLRGWDNATMTVPNGALAQQRINNMHGSNHFYAQWYEIKISSEIDPYIVKALLLEAALQSDKLLRRPRPAVRLANATTDPYVYTVWVHFPNFMSMFAGREQLFREIHRALNGVGISVSSDIHELRYRRTKPPLVETATTRPTLQALDIASLLTAEELDHLADTCTWETYDAGSIIVAEGQVTQSLEIVVNGIVETSVSTADGQMELIGEIGPGQYFGLYSMIVDGPSFQHFAAATEVTVICIRMEHIRTLLQTRPALQEEFAKIVQHRIDTAQEVRLRTNNSAARLTLPDILSRIQELVR